MNRRDVALYKLANYMDKMQKSADGFDIKEYGNNLKNQSPTMALLAMLGGTTGRAVGGKGKGTLLGALGLPAVYAAYLAGKKGNGGFGLYDEPAWLNKSTGFVNDTVNGAIDAGKQAIGRYFPSKNK